MHDLFGEHEADRARRASGAPSVLLLQLAAIEDDIDPKDIIAVVAQIWSHIDSDDV